MKRGFEVEIYERRPDMRRSQYECRTIDQSGVVYSRDPCADGKPGLWNEMQKIIIPMKGRMMHSVTSELTFQRYGKDDSEVIDSISRAELNIALMNAAEANGVLDSFPTSDASE